MHAKPIFDDKEPSFPRDLQKFINEERKRTLPKKATTLHWKDARHRDSRKNKWIPFRNPFVDYDN